MAYKKIALFACLLFPLHAMAVDGINSVKDSDLPLGANDMEYMRIKKDGNIGIGTDSPIGTLDIENTNKTATLCLNGKCTKTLNFECPDGQALAGIKDGSPVCKKGFGGTYTKTIVGTAGDGQIANSPITWGTCWLPNPATGDCSCPSGFVAFILTGFDDRSECKYYNWPGQCGMYVFGCY